MRITIPRQIMELTRRIDAVYVWLENGHQVIGRTPIIALALCDKVEFSDDFDEDDEGRVIEKGILKYIWFSSEEDFDLDTSGNLLGYEIDGKEEDWKREIESYFKREKEKEEKRELHRQRVSSIKAKLGDKVAKDFGWKWIDIPGSKKETEAFERLMGQSAETNKEGFV